MTERNAHINYSFADIERYLNGGMTAKEMHDLERAALQDPFLADAIEGYRHADTKLANKHLNDIVAALQKEEPAKVMVMPKKKRYGWLVAASLLAVVGTGVFLFSGRDNYQKNLAAHDVIQEARKAAPADSSGASQNDSKIAPLRTDSEPPLASAKLASPKGEKKEENSRIAMAQEQKSFADKDIAVEPQREDTQTSDLVAAAPAPTGNLSETSKPVLLQEMAAKKPALAQSLTDSAHSRFAEAAAAPVEKRRQNAANTWTTEKGKPFLLSDVEVINLGNEKKKRKDTLSIHPEGGWQSFQNYLFSRLSRRDSLLLVKSNYIPKNMELEFSVDETGSPYNIKVMNAGDSIVTNKIANAIQSGPKWKSKDSKEKRLRIRY